MLSIGEAPRSKSRSSTEIINNITTTFMKGWLLAMKDSRVVLNKDGVPPRIMPGIAVT